MLLVESRNLRGYIREFNDQKKYMFIRLHDGSRDFFCHFDDIDAPGNHFCLLSRSQAVVFDTAVGREGKIRAVNVRLESPPELPEREVSTVVEWNRTTRPFGYAVRDCVLGCHIHFSENNILSCREGIASLKPGSRIYHGTTNYITKMGKSRCTATEIEICLE